MIFKDKLKFYFENVLKKKMLVILLTYKFGISMMIPLSFNYV